MSAGAVDIHTAAWKGEIDTVRRFLLQDGGIVNAVDETLYGGA